MARYAYEEPFAGQRPEDRRAVDDALELTGLTPLADRSLATLSGGERQQAFIAAALAQRARALLLDEPTAFLDYRHQVRVHAILRSIRQETRTTICIVTHDLNEAVAVADRVLALREGQVAFAGTCDELLDPAVLRDIYDVEFTLVDRGEGLRPLVVPAGIDHAVDDPGAVEGSGEAPEAQRSSASTPRAAGGDA
jgi:iron complex transport system ATP-binding protein